MNSKIDILSLTLEELTEEMVALKQPSFRAKQVFQWLHVKKVSNFSDMTNISAQLQQTLNEIFYINVLNIKKTLVSDTQNTVKYLYELCDGETIETVLMSHRHGNSLCVSSQVGCRMGCGFCASGTSKTSGLVRNLTASEMLSQLYTLTKLDKNIHSVVIMGIGEPLDNYDNVLKFLRILQSPDGHNMSLRHVSLSTCGIVPKIDELAKLRLGLTLSVSLHAVTDEERSAIMPINRKYPLALLMKACSNYFNETHRRISFEYALISGVNDSVETAAKLAGLLISAMPKGSYHVNVIPINEINNNAFRKSANVNAFVSAMEREGVTTTVRRTMGADINAACGQLRNSTTG